MDLLNVKIETPTNANERYMYLQLMFLKGIYEELKKINKKEDVVITNTVVSDIIKPLEKKSESVAKRTATRSRKKKEV